MALLLRVRNIPPLCFLLCLLVSTSILCTNSRLPHGAVVRLPSLTASPHLSGRMVPPSGSFLSMALPLRRASFSFGSPEESRTPEVLAQGRKPRSASVGSERKTPSGVWSREGGILNQMQPKQEQGTQQKQNQQQQRRIGRLARLRRALKRFGGAAKEKLRRLFSRIRRGLSQAKRAARHAAVRVYTKLPRLRKPKSPSEEAQEAAASRLAGAGLVGTVTGLPSKEALEEAKTPEEGELFTPVSPAISTTSTSAEEATAQPAQAKIPPPAPEGLEQAEEMEEWHEAPTPEEFEESSEEWHDAVSTEELGRVLARARESEQMKKEEELVQGKAQVQEKIEEQKQEEADELGLTPQCLKFLPRMTPTMKKVNRNWRGHCMFWSLFMRNGNFGTFVDFMQDLAVDTGALITRAELLKGTEENVDAQVLRMTLNLALEEDAVAIEEDKTEEYCWFLDPEKMFSKANPTEEAVINAINPVSFFGNPLKYTQPLHRLVEMAYADTFRCLTSIDAEIRAREALQQTLATEKQKLEDSAERLLHSLPSQQTGDLLQAIEELEMLRKREACSIEKLYLMSGQGKNTQNFIADYRANGQKWWKAQWPFKLQMCRPLGKGSEVVPKDVAQVCRAYESSRSPKRANDVSRTLLWIWDAGSCRMG